MTLLSPLRPPAQRRPLPYPRPVTTQHSTPGLVVPGRAPAPQIESAQPADVRTARWPGLALFSLLTIGYIVIGTVLSMRYSLSDPDGPSRVADAAYVIFSRDPHLGAVGFIWNPLPSFVEIPILPLKYLWYPIQSYGVAGIIQSALFMAGSAVLVRRMALHLGLPPWSRRTVVIGFALNPMIVDFGANGMSEASMIFFATWACYRLLRWFRSGHVLELSVAGLAFGLGYLSRYEILASAASASVAVAAVTTSRYRHANPEATLRSGAVRGLHNVLILLFPAGLSFGGWAIAGWLLTGQPFAQFSSQYGNTSQLATRNSTGDSTKQIASWIVQAMISLEPLLLVVVVVAIFLAVRRRRPDVLAPLACFGGIIAFEALAQLKGFTFGWFRFYICTVPLTCVLFMTVWRDYAFSRPVVWLTSRLSATPFKLTSRRASRFGFALLTCALLLPSLPVTWLAMLNPQISNQFAQYGLRYIVTSKPKDEDAIWWSTAYYDTHQIARYLDSLDLPNGSVLIDTFVGWSIWLASTRPHQFVITSDYDFMSALNNPRGYHIQYIMVSTPARFNSQDAAVNLRYPTLWDNGAGFATLVQTFTQEGGEPTWKLYKVNDT